MAALLVAMAVMANLMSAALPVWRHEMQREK
jgi:type II secretory pathway pseudopilin PulG